jgi:hypothetical protein
VRVVDAKLHAKHTRIDVYGARLSLSAPPLPPLLTRLPLDRCVRCPSSNIIVHSRMLLVPTPDRLQLLHACDQ